MHSLSPTERHFSKVRKHKLVDRKKNTSNLGKMKGQRNIFQTKEQIKPQEKN